MADFFKTLETENTGAPPQWLSDHPNTGNREQAIENEIRNWPPKQYASDSPAFQKTKQHAMGVKVYTGEEIAKAPRAANGLSSISAMAPCSPARLSRRTSTHPFPATPRKRLLCRHGKASRPASA